MAYLVKGIKPVLNISAMQRYVQDDTQPLNPTMWAYYDNDFVPTSSVSSKTAVGYRNNNFAGYRFEQETLEGQTYGSLKIVRFTNNDAVVTDLLKINENGTIDFNATTSFDGLGLTSPLKIEVGSNDIASIFLEKAGLTWAYISYDNSNSANKTLYIGANDVVDMVLQLSTGKLKIERGVVNLVTIDNNVFEAITDFRVNNTSLIDPEKGFLLAYNGTEKANLNYNNDTSTLRLSNLGNFPIVFSSGGQNIFNAQYDGTDRNIDFLNSKLLNANFPALNLPKLGIGITPTVDGRIQFAATQMVNKLSLFNSSGNDYNQSGFGYNSFGTLYHAPSFTSHTFYLGDNTTIPLRVNALGITIAELRPINADFRRIMFYDEGENVNQVYNIGIKDLGSSNYAIHNQVSNLNAAFTWGAALNPSSSADLMSLRGDEPTQKINLKIMNPLAAAVGVPAYTQFDLVNSTSGGVRFLHTSSTTDTVGLGSLKVQLVNNIGGTLDAFTVDNGSFGAQTTFDGPAIFNTAVTIQNNATTLLTGNALTLNPLVITNLNASGNTFIRFNNVLKIGYDNANFRSYIDSTVPFNVTLSGTSGLYIDNVTRNIGIGTTTPHAPLQFQNLSVNRKIVLHEDTNNDHQFYGFGINNGSLRYQVSSTASDHIWYAASNSTTSSEVGRLKGIGDLIIPGTIYGSRASGGYYMEANATVTAVAANTWTKIAGVTTSFLLNQFTSTNNRITYTGTQTIRALIIGTVTASHNVFLGATLGFSIFKNNGRIIPSASFRQSGQNEISHASFITTVSLSTNDFIEVFGQSTAAGNITASYLTLDVTST